jgi:tripeptidyl-peptidase-1
LYTIGQFGLNDITTGEGTGCNGLGRFNGAPNGSPVIPNASWPAVKGWDAVTGLGTPDFGKLLKLSTPFAKNEGGYNTS